MPEGRILRSFSGEFWGAVAPNGELDAEWPNVPADIRERMQFVRVAREDGLSTTPQRINFGGNSGYQAIGLAYLWGAKRIILLGYDMQKTGGKKHHHADHKGLPNLGDLDSWRRHMNLLAVDLRKQGVEVLNASRETALKCFERTTPEQAFV